MGRRGLLGVCVQDTSTGRESSSIKTLGAEEMGLCHPRVSQLTRHVQCVCPLTSLSHSPHRTGGGPKFCLSGRGLQGI